jgi:hypothetical protein
MNDNVCHAGALIRQEKGHMNLTDIAQKLNILLENVHSIVQDQLDYKKVCISWVPKNPTDDYKAHRTGLTFMNVTCYAYQGQQFLQCTVPRDEAMVSVRKNMTIVFRDHKGEFLVDFLSCGVTMTVVHLTG